jgi:putative MATE family efflux protein
VNKPSPTNPAAVAAPPTHPLPLAAGREPSLLKQLLILALPVLSEHVLHIGVGLTDTWLANNLVWESGLGGEALASARATNASATAAVGSITYIMWLMGLITGAVGTGATAIISRAIGARHKRVANGVCGQAVLCAVLAGAIIAVVAYLAAPALPRLFNLPAGSEDYFVRYVRLLAWSLPFLTLMFVAGSCLRGAGDTLSPAIAMIVVDVVNIVLSVGLTYGIWGMPKLGFDGIAWGTVVAYVVGGLLLFGVLTSGRGRIRLYLHRLRPNWTTLRRILRIGIPNGIEGAVHWAANFGVIFAVNGLGAVAAAAHMNAIRIESLSYMSGFAFATAAATLTGQSLGRRDPARARRVALLATMVGGAVMAACGVAFVLFGTALARQISSDPQIVEQTASALRVTGFIQFPFAVGMILSGSLRGAGDTMAVMLLNLASIVGVRFIGVIVVAKVFGMGLTAIWVVLSAELTVRGFLVTGRFLSGRWQHVKV